MRPSSDILVRALNATSRMTTANPPINLALIVIVCLAKTIAPDVAASLPHEWREFYQNQ
jgi:hypothetical protein